ncbi:MAG: efflux RND transporter permease subunit, partial [Alphaproteobacteria bacterium]|nr:efflux RND transporter permease subunit [Alphaproteobacteria bacterium]
WRTPGTPEAQARAKALAADGDGDLGSVSGFTGFYVRVLRTALRRPALVVAGTVALLFASIGLYGALGHGVEFFPDVEPDQAQVLVHARGNFATDQLAALVEEVDVELQAMQAERGEFASIYSLAGVIESRDELPEDVVGKFVLEFVDWEQRRKADDILAEIRERTAGIPGIHVEASKPRAGPPVGKPVQVRLTSRDPAALEAEAARVRAFFDRTAGLIEIEDGGAVPGIEWELSVDRAQAAKFGADVSLVGSFVQMVTRGFKVSSYRPDDSDDEIDIVVRFPEAQRSIGRLDELRVETTNGQVPVSNFVSRHAEVKTGTLRRVGGVRAMTVKADVAPGVLVDDKVREIRAWLQGEGKPDPKVAWTFKGEDAEQKVAQAFLVKAFGVALFIMAIILLAQFNSFYSAGLILFAVVMSTIGVFLGLLIIGQPFGIVMSGIGVIALAGIVVNNNIVLIDTWDRLKREIADPVEAILLTGAQRLRPVMLTTVTTILGLVPMMLQANIDFVARSVSVGAPSTQWWVQLSTAVAFGLGFATVLTLVVTPCALLLRMRLSQAPDAAADDRPDCLRPVGRLRRRPVAGTGASPAATAAE